MAISVIATITNLGRSKIADMTISGRGFQVQQLVVGSGGHDTGDVTIAISPEPNDATLRQQTFGPKDLVFPAPPLSGILVTPFCPTFHAFLDFTEANGPVSNYGLIARVTSSLIPLDPLIGTTFLFAIGNTPLKTKTDGDQWDLEILLQT